MMRSTNSTTFALPREAKIIGVIFVMLTVLLALCIGSGRGFAQTSASERSYNDGLAHFNLKNYSAAISEWEKLLNSDPNYQEKEKVWYSIASAAILMQTSAGDEKAVVYLDKIISQKDVQGNPVRGAYYEQSLFLIGRALFNRATQLREAGDPNKLAKNTALAAQQMFDQLLAEFPTASTIPQALKYQVLIALNHLQSVTEVKRYAEMALLKISETTTDSEALEIRKDCHFYYAWALAHGSAADVEQARRIFGSFMTTRDAKRGPLSVYELAFTYYRAGDFQKTQDNLNTFRSYFPTDTPEVLKAFLNVQRLQAMCYFQTEDYTRAMTLLENIVKQQDMPSFEDAVYLILCYMRTGQFTKAEQNIAILEQKYVNTNFMDGVKVLRAGYYYGLDQYANAYNLLNSVLWTDKPTASTPLTFKKRPMTAEVDDSLKCGLSEEHFLRAASLLAICYAKAGNMTIAWEVYTAMQQVTNDMFGRYSSIRDKTLSQLRQIEQNPPMPGVTSPPGTTNPPGIVVTPPGTGSGGGSNIITSPGSIVRPPGSSNNLANKPLSPDDQEDWIKNCQARVDSAGDNAGYLEDVLADLHMLLANWSMSKYNHARVAVMIGRIWYKQDKVRDAYLMFEMAYDLIDNDKEANNRNTETFSVAAFRLGEYAEKSGRFTEAAKYFEQSLATGSGQSVKYRDSLMYRMGSALLYVPGRRLEGLWFLENVFDEMPLSKFWSHAGLQVAIDDFQNRRYDKCEEVIDKLIEAKPDAAIIDRVLYLKGELAILNKQWDIAYDSFDAIQVYAPTGSPFIGLAKQKQSVVRNQMR